MSGRPAGRGRGSAASRAAGPATAAAAVVDVLGAPLDVTAGPDAAADTVPAPRLRGRLHAGAAVVSVVTGVALVAVAGPLRGAAAGWSTAVYAVTVLALFTVSGCYHRLAWSPRGHAVMKRLDHSMIFVFIAGTYTPVAVLALPRASAGVVLAVVWCGALAGVALKTRWPHAPRWIGVSLYLAMGWTAVFVFPALLRGGGADVLLLVAAGGLAYTAGAVAYATRRPNPFPRTFGFHEVFHALTLVAALCHYLAIWLLVVRSVG